MTANEILKQSEQSYKSGNLDEAERLIRAAIQADPRLSEARSYLGNILQQQGKFEEAVETFRAAIDLRITNTGAYLGIVSCKKIDESDLALIAQMRYLMREGFQPQRDRSMLHYALGKALDHLGDYEEAMNHFDEANWIMGNQPPCMNFDPGIVARNVDWLRDNFDSAYFRRSQDGQSESQVSIFVLGMIRSGTTLLERILSSHPSVSTGGELAFWQEKQHKTFHVSHPTPPRPPELRAMGADFDKVLEPLAQEASHVVDKTPFNFLAVGLMHAALPKAKIIHCRRKPVDNCLSIYVTPFRQPIDFGHKRQHIILFYREYLRLMSHWRAVLPPEIFLEVDYEDLVEHREEATRRILDFCGLTWNEQCLRPETNEKKVITPSMWQVRQGVYNTSLDRWRNYEPWLGSFQSLMELEPGSFRGGGPV